jgi:hypothetical protein
MGVLRPDIKSTIPRDNRQKIFVGLPLPRRSGFSGKHLRTTPTSHKKGGMVKGREVGSGA